MRKRGSFEVIAICIGTCWLYVIGVREGAELFKVICTLCAHTALMCPFCISSFA